jgi:hypothetical protein
MAITSTIPVNLQLPKTVEDWLLFLIPIIGLLAGFNWGGLIPGASGLIVGIAIGSLAKTLIGLGQTPHLSNWEDWFSLITTFLGFLGTAFSANPLFLVYGTIIGLLLKSLGFIKAGLNVEDIMLALGALIAGYGQLSGNPALLNAGLLIGIIGKTMPSLGTNGSPTTLTVTATPATP